jgi:hypothetical protein
MPVVGVCCGMAAHYYYNHKQQHNDFIVYRNLLFLYQWLNTATSLPADDAHHYVIPQKLIDSILNKFPVFIRQWEKEKSLLYPVEFPPP